MSSEISSFLTKVNLVQESLNQILKQFQDNPANFFFEEELRSILFNILREKFQSNNITASLISDKWLKKYIENKINPVKAEYGKDAGYFSNYNIKNMDIAILSSEFLYKKENLNNYQRYCDIIIEIKYSTEDVDSKHAGFFDDVEKVRNARHTNNFLGLAICFDLHNFRSELEEKSFLNNYKLKEILFNNIDTSNIIIPEGKCFSIYINPKKVFISQPLESKQNDKQNQY